DGGGGYEDVAEDSQQNGEQESPVMGDEKTVPGSTGAADRKYIYRGEIFLNVEDIRESENRIREQVESQGGFIEASRYYSDPKGETHTTYLTVRVPYPAFYNTMEFLETLGKMVNRRTGSSDVTLQYVDMEARIRVLTKQEERFTEILAQAKTVEEILEIERELVKVRSEIESLTSQFNHLKDRVDYATIDISLQQTVLATPGLTMQGFKGAWGRAIQGLTENINRIINGLAGLFVFSLSSLPFLLLLAAAAYIFIKFRKARKKDREEE
ncbi:MAG TPA: DUF4349 domain-containing protein, partial [Firmicutes bacterium]|nr:DUF4349 domain-containing protein [Bacillota bacterium]